MHSRRNIELHFLRMMAESRSCDLSPLFIKTTTSPRIISDVVAFVSPSTPPSQYAEFDFIRFHILVPFHESHTLRGTVIGFASNLPNFASAYEMHTRVASKDGIFCSRFMTSLLFRDALSNDSYVSK
jgi:hypothetical protein